MDGLDVTAGHVLVTSAHFHAGVLGGVTFWQNATGSRYLIAVR
jgi:hypothetical protein